MIIDRIDHVMLMNLERNLERFWFALGALRAFGFPFHGSKEFWDDTIKNWFNLRSVIRVPPNLQALKIWETI